MNLDEMANEVLNRLLEKMQEHKSFHADFEEKKYLNSSESSLKIIDYKPEFLGTVFQKDKVQEYEFLVVNDLTIDEMIAAANGTSINPKTCAIRDFLLRGKPVYVLEEGVEYHSFKAVSNPVYFRLLQEYEDKLSQFGIRILSLVALEKVFYSKRNRQEIIPEAVTTIEQPLSVQTDSGTAFSTDKKLITYDLAKKLIDKKELIFKKGTIITPYAQDVFKENGNIIIIKDK